MINYRFLNYKHYKTFQDELDQISDDSIVFIQDECCIWARGQLYRCGGGSGTATLDSHTLNFVDDHGNLEFTIMQDGNDLVLKDGEGNESRASYVLEGDLHAVAYSGSYNDLKDKPTQYTVDGSLSSTSTNPVQNKVIAEALAGKANSSAFSNYVTNEEFTSGLNSKQNKLTAGRGINITSNTISSTLDTEVYKIVTELPSISEADPNKIYLLEARNQDGTYRYIQYRVRNGAWVSFDTVTPGFDLSEYLKSSVAEQTYQHKGDYLTAASLLPYFKTEEAQLIYDRFNEYALQTYVDDTFQRKGDYATNEYVNKTFVTRAEVYNPKQTDMGSDAIVDGGGISGSGTSGTSNVIVDSTLSLSSANPVQNRIITSELSKKVDKTDMAQYAKLSDVQNKVDQISLAGLATTVEVNQKLAEKQNALTAGNGITIINDVISTNLDTAAFEIVTELPAVNINPSKIYLLEHEENGDYTYTQWRFREGDWVEVGQVVPQIDLQPYLTKSEAQTTYATKNELANDYQPKGSYLTTLAAEENYQPKGSYVNSDLFDATVRTIESTYQRRGDYVLASEVAQRLQELQQLIDNKYVLKKDVYNPYNGNWSEETPSDITVNPSDGGVNPGSGSGTGGKYKLITLTTAEYEALVNVNQVEDDTYYFTYEADSGWTFGGRFPITLS